MIKQAKERYPNLNFFHYDGLQVLFPDKNFDLCFSCWVFQNLIHEPDSKNILAELARVLTKEGRLVMIEQVSMSNQASGTVEKASTTEDYFHVLANFFEVLEIHNVRSCQQTLISGIFLKLAKYCPSLFYLFLDFLTYWEINFIKKQPASYFKKLEYYDIMIIAKVKEVND